MIVFLALLSVFLLLYFVKDQRNTHYLRKRALFVNGVTKYSKYKKHLYIQYIFQTKCIQALTVHTGHSSNILPYSLEKSFCALEVQCVWYHPPPLVWTSLSVPSKIFGKDNILIHIHLFQVFIRYLKSPCSCCPPRKN